jgi:hypothetical protein
VLGWMEVDAILRRARRFQGRLNWCVESVPLHWELCLPSESPYGEPWRLRMA